jgi:hypothetical protein
VVTTFGLIGTITTGFIGMNLIGLTEVSLAEKVIFFMVIFVPTAFLTFYTIVKSRACRISWMCCRMKKCRARQVQGRCSTSGARSG